MKFRFVEPEQQAVNVPYFEDSTADTAPYYQSAKNYSVHEAKGQVAAELAKLGAYVNVWMDVEFESHQGARRGYIIRYAYGGQPAQLKVAGLPTRHTLTARKLQHIQVQVLFNVRDWLKAMVTSKVFNPGFDALIGTVLMPGEEARTIADYIREVQTMPALGDGKR